VTFGNALQKEISKTFQCSFFVPVNDFQTVSSEISEIAGVAEATIRQSYKLMYPKAKSIFPEDFDFYTPISLLPSF